MKQKIIFGILAVLISIGLWLYVVTVVNPEWEETFYDVPVVFTHTEILQSNDYMLLIEDEPKVTLRLSGNRTDMIKLNSGNIQLQINVANLREGEYLLDYAITYPDGMSANAFEIVSQTPSQIPVTVVRAATTTLGDSENEIRFAVQNVPEGFKALEDEAVSAQQTIKITGPVDVVKSIAYADITYDANQSSDSVNRKLEYVLRDENGNPVDTKWLTMTPEQVECNVYIFEKIEKEPTVALIGDNENWNKEITYYACVGEQEEKIEKIVVAGNGDVISSFLVNEKLNLGDLGLTAEEKAQLEEKHSVEISGMFNLQELFAGKRIVVGEDKYTNIKVVVKITQLTGTH